MTFAITGKAGAMYFAGQFHTQSNPEQVRAAERAAVSFAKIEYLPLLKTMFHLVRFQRQYHMEGEKNPSHDSTLIAGYLVVASLLSQMK